MHLIEDLRDIVWYNGWEDNLREIRNTVATTEESIIFYHPGFAEFEMLWMILVLEFGNYGTSPRSGWLDMGYRNQIVDFINQILPEESTDAER